MQKSESATSSNRFQSEIRNPKFAILLAIVFAIFAGHAVAQQSRPPKYEVRAVWITTVSSLDWPRSLNVEEQQKSLRAMIDKVAKANFNTVYFQIRGRGDALYQSNYEPWSAVLTGTVGKDPGWDPLAFAIQEAHARGLELHAWFNTFLVKNAGGGGRQSVVTKHPEWVHVLNGESWLDPGIPAARDYTVKVAMDIVRNYDIDGFHFDFMRYPQGGYSDDDAFRAHNPKHLTKSDWRRSNVNAFISAFYDSATHLKRHLKVGSAPIGIYSNFPGVNGLQSYDNLYQDSREWLRAGYHDYIVPQVYWALGRSGGHPDFALVAKDWAANTFGRQVILGTAPYKSDIAPQIPRMIDTTRSFGVFAGNSFFRYEHIAPIIGVGNRYAYPAITPPMPWKDSIPPLPPVAMRVTNTDDNTFRLTWREPPAARDGDVPKCYHIYRSGVQPVDVSDIRNLIATVPAGTNTYEDRISHPISGRYSYTVVSVDAGNNESGHPTEESVVLPEIVQISKRFDGQFRLSAPVPAVISDFAYFMFEIPQSSAVTLGIYDTQDNELLRVVDDTKSAGRYVATANLEKLKDGEYRYRLTASSGVFKGVFSIER